MEAEISKLLPTAKEHELTLGDLISSRDAANRLAQLAEQKTALLAKRAEYEAMKQSQKDQPKVVCAGNEVYEFSKMVGSILEEWKFPGGTDVTFDEATYDIKIDGILRTLNGKGVRALTMRPSRLAFCCTASRTTFRTRVSWCWIRRCLPIAIPSIPRRVRSPTMRRSLPRAPYSENFFRHLASLEGQAQFIVLDNIDPPANIEQWADTELFSGTKRRVFGSSRCSLRRAGATSEPRPFVFRCCVQPLVS